MDMLLNHADYPCLFKLDIVGNDGIDVFSPNGNKISPRNATTYSSGNSTISDAEIAETGGGPIVGWYCGGSYISSCQFGTVYTSSGYVDRYVLQICNYGEATTVTPNNSVQMCMMLPLCHVERVFYE